LRYTRTGRATPGGCSALFKAALREDLQTAFSAGAANVQVRDNAATGATNIVNTPGFYKYNLNMAILSDNTASVFEVALHIYDGSANKVIHNLRNSADASGQEPLVVFHTGILFLTTGDFLQIANVGVDTFIQCSAWQIADVNGNLVNPSGFSFE